MLRDYYLKKLTCEKRDCYEKIIEGYLHRKDKSKPQIPPRPKQENRAHVHEPGQNIRIDQSEV